MVIRTLYLKIPNCDDPSKFNMLFFCPCCDSRDPIWIAAVPKLERALHVILPPLQRICQTAAIWTQSRRYGSTTGNDKERQERTFQALYRLHFIQQIPTCSRTFWMHSKYSLWSQSPPVSVKGQLVHSGAWRLIWGTRWARTDSLDLRWCTCIVTCMWTLRISWGHLQKGIHAEWSFLTLCRRSEHYSHGSVMQLSHIRPKIDRSKVLLMCNVFSQ